MTEKLQIIEEIERNGFFVRTFRGHSMMPMLDEKKDAVRLVPVKERLKKFDIPLFIRDDGKLILHRVIVVKENGYLIRGDNCTKSEFVRDDQIIAVTEGIYKDGEYHACTEPEVMCFAGRQKRTLLLRTLQRYWRRGKGKLSKFFRRLTGKRK